jgi:Ca2+-dependent lipid-binding protein
LVGSDEIKETKLIEDSDQSPVWKETFYFRFRNKDEAIPLEITVWDHDDKGEDQKLASVEIPLPQEAGMIDDWYNLKAETELKSPAAIHLVFTTSVERIQQEEEEEEEEEDQ